MVNLVNECLNEVFYYIYSAYRLVSGYYSSSLRYLFVIGIAFSVLFLGVKVIGSIVHK